MPLVYKTVFKCFAAISVLIFLNLSLLVQHFVRSGEGGDKMTPLCLACSLSFLVLWLFLNIVLVLAWDDAEQFIYDRKSFMEIGNAVLSGEYIGSGVTCLDFPSFASFQWDIPDYLQRRPGATLRRKRRRRRGKRSGVAIRLKAEIGYRGRRSV